MKKLLIIFLILLNLLVLGQLNGILPTLPGRIAPDQNAQSSNASSPSVEKSPDAARVPLLNSRGEMIGINTAIAAEGQNIGFALPVNLVKQLLNKYT